MIPAIACVGNDRPPTPIKTGLWSHYEEELLAALVRQHGPRHWSVISADIHSGKPELTPMERVQQVRLSPSPPLLS
jgi:hypothetical protein